MGAALTIQELDDSWLDCIQPGYDELGQPNFMTPTGDLVTGIFVDIPNEVYHSLPALSSSGLKKFRVSPAHYYREYMSDIERKRTTVQQRTLDAGTYGHELVLEPDGFYDRYYRGIVESQMEKGVLFTADDLKKELIELGAPHSGKKDELAKRLLKLAPEKKIFTVMQEELAKANPDKQLIDGVVWDDAHRIMDSVYKSVDAPVLLEDGFSELTVIATCPMTGLILKCRFDRLRRDAVASDVKTTMDASPEGFRRQIEKLGYHLQEAFYTHVARAAGIPIEHFWFIAVEYQQADICEVYEIGPKGKQKSMFQFLQHLNEFKAVSEDEDWYGYSKDRTAKTIELSRWA
ncbi:PD-(D/E)XK nuclease-like domain-containing protein [Neiella sp. HB171785]|uniref:PD-(D/E)XK nuclease-like domain-containing protein n=1 Tax=Neiella litorisoli TaxID=2771431 RepID=A0A8J6UPT4_9GAMM|nr:PD-(D/E)XK nuclease-like domain-containing protein [Neiella litorisoli]MBD1389417.1 PD-(D/E)XK nuclease-like domain-containing protein [Neiella litorisoli]